MVAIVVIPILFGCGQSNRPNTLPSNSASASEGQAPRVKKVLVAGIGAPLPPFGPLGRVGTYVGAIQYIEAHSNGLVTSDENGRPIPQLAADLPSLERGTATILEDGRMVTTWALRPNVTWHDGERFTAHDIAFGFTVYSDLQLPAMDRSAVLQIESVDVVDDFTARITWKAPYYLAGSLGLKLLWPLPMHLLAESYASGDRERFLNLPYWSTDYVHTGPFRLAQLDPGAEAVFQAYDGYYQGRPRIDTLVIRPILDPNALYASVLSGDIDLTIGPIEGDQAVSLQDQWQQTHAGSVVTTVGNSTVMSFQLAPELAGSKEVLDPLIRQGLHFAVDRAGLTELSTGGRSAPELEGRSLLPPTDPLYSYVADVYAERAGNPSRAIQRFAEVGWQRGSDGLLVSAGERRLSIEVRASRENLGAAIASGWRQVGVDASVTVPSQAQSLDLEWAQAFPGVQVTAQTAGDSILNMLYGPTMATARNNFGGNNRGHYNSAQMNALIDRFRASLPERDRGPLMRQIADLIAEDQPIIQPNFNPIYGSVRSGVHALGDLRGGYISGGQFGAYSRSSFLWDKD